MSGSDLNFRAAYIKKTGSMGNFRRDGGFQNISATTSSSSYRGSEPCICERSQLPAATSLPAESHFTLGRGQRVSETQCHAAWPWPLQGHRWAGPGQCPYSPQECGLDEGLLPPPHSCPTRWKTGRGGGLSRSCQWQCSSAAKAVCPSRCRQGKADRFQLCDSSRIAWTLGGVQGCLQACGNL